VARRGKRPSAPVPPGRYSRRYDPVEVYLTRRAVGATLAGKLHNLPRRTVYNACATVEADADLMAQANAIRTKIQAAHESSLAALQADAITALRARIAAGTIPPQHLVAILAALGGGGGQRSGKTALEVPAILATPRLDTPHDGAPP